MAELNRKNLMEGLFGPVNESPKAMEEGVVVPIDKMLDFHSEVVKGKAHPFRRLSQSKLEELAESIKQNGLLYPVKLREDREFEGYYEIIAGHNRRDALKLLGKKQLSTEGGEIEIVEADDENAVNQMIATNIQREEIAIMDKAWAYRIWMENNKRESGRKNASQIETQKRSDEILAEESGQSRATIQRLIRLTCLIEGFQNSLDLKILQMNPAYELTFLSPEQQEEVLKYMNNGNKIKIDQAKALREEAEHRFLSEEDVAEFLTPKMPADPMKTVLRQTEKRFKKYDQGKLAKVDVDVLEDLIFGVVDHYLEELES